MKKQAEQNISETGEEHLRWSAFWEGVAKNVPSGRLSLPRARENTRNSEHSFEQKKKDPGVQSEGLARLFFLVFTWILRNLHEQSRDLGFSPAFFFLFFAS
jgi:hypothetical protein